jgi:hypothetical protein
MNDFIALLGAGFHGKRPAASPEIMSLETSLGVAFPSAYREFLSWSDGGEGAVGDLYLSLWSVGQVAELNGLYSITRRMGRGFVGIGTDGGGYCFALELRGGERFVAVPLGALAESEVKHLADSLTYGLARIRDGYITGKDL